MGPYGFSVRRGLTEVPIRILIRNPTPLPLFERRRSNMFWLDNFFSRLPPKRECTEISNV